MKWMLWMLLAGMLVGGRIARAGEDEKKEVGFSATQPVVKVGDVPGERVTRPQMKKLFLDLEDPDGGVREKARERMLGMKRADLPTLLELVGEYRPLEEQMKSAIKEIVTHVYLAEDEYEKEARGFLGISMPKTADEDRMQVIIESRMAGFGGFATLRDGDVVLDIVDQPLPQPLDREVFIDVIKTMEPGRNVRLKVLRQGAVRIVPVKISARPAERAAVNAMAYEQRVAELLYKRSEEAEGYWKDRFAPVVGEEAAARVGASN
jgi:hypothetical protein